MEEIQIEELRELELQILDYFDAFCRKNGIHYTLSGGTLLGAIRHGGFIPWDDDVDVQMLRSDYVRFTELWNKTSLEHPFVLVSLESGNSMGYPFGKIHNPRTVTFLKGVKRTGVFIDVFPLDDVIDEKDFVERRVQLKRLKKKERWAFILTTVDFSIYGIYHFLKGLVITLGRPREYYARRINEIAKSKNGHGGKMVFEMVAGLKCKSPMKKSLFYDFADIKFENKTYMAVKDYDAYLTATFGDYMIPPPVEKQVREHDFIPYWL